MIWIKRTLLILGICFGVMVISSVSPTETNVDYKKEIEVLVQENHKLADVALKAIKFSITMVERDSLLTIENKSLKRAYVASEHLRIYGGD